MKNEKIYPNSAVNEAKKNKKHYIIQDWTGQLMDFGSFKTFDDAESFLSVKLGDNYDTDRQEYYIIEESI